MVILVIGLSRWMHSFSPVHPLAVHYWCRNRSIAPIAYFALLASEKVGIRTVRALSCDEAVA